jgi:hypothetical protein
MTLPAAALMLLCMATSTAAQSMGEVVGSIVDQTGAPLPGVRVTIRGVAVRTAETGAAGDFAFPDLPAGEYEMSAELSGLSGRVVPCACESANGSPCPSPCASPLWALPDVLDLRGSLLLNSPSGDKTWRYDSSAASMRFFLGRQRQVARTFGGVSARPTPTSPKRSSAGNRSDR